MSQTVTLVELDPLESNGPPIAFNRPSATSSNEVHDISLVPQSVEPSADFLPKRRSIIVIATLAGVSFLNCVSAGFLTVGLPRIAVDVKLPEHLLLWYENDLLVYGLLSDACM